MPEQTKRSIYLFSEETPMGEMFNLTDDEVEAKLEDGWLTSPKDLDIPEEEPVISMEDAKNANPQDIIELVKSMGFMVVTPDQLKAEANKMASVVLDIEKFSDEALIAEAERRGLKDSDEGPTDTEGEPLINRFIQSPTDLTKEELVTLGAEYKLGLRMNFSEQTMIDKITEAIEASKSEEG